MSCLNLAVYFSIRKKQMQVDLGIQVIFLSSYFKYFKICIFSVLKDWASLSGSQLAVVWPMFYRTKFTQKHRPLTC